MHFLFTIVSLFIFSLDIFALNFKNMEINVAEKIIEANINTLDHSESSDSYIEAIKLSLASGIDQANYINSPSEEFEDEIPYVQETNENVIPKNANFVNCEVFEWMLIRIDELNKRAMNLGEELYVLSTQRELSNPAVRARILDIEDSLSDISDEFRILADNKYFEKDRTIKLIWNLEDVFHEILDSVEMALLRKPILGHFYVGDYASGFFASSKYLEIYPLVQKKNFPQVESKKVYLKGKEAGISSYNNEFLSSPLDRFEMELNLSANEHCSLLKNEKYSHVIELTLFFEMLSIPDLNGLSSDALAEEQEPLFANIVTSPLHIVNKNIKEGSVNDPFRSIFGISGIFVELKAKLGGGH